jgi:hypothetical protein
MKHEEDKEASRQATVQEFLIKVQDQQKKRAKIVAKVLADKRTEDEKKERERKREEGELQLMRTQDTPLWLRRKRVSEAKERERAKNRPVHVVPSEEPQHQQSYQQPLKRTNSNSNNIISNSDPIIYLSLFNCCKCHTNSSETMLVFVSHCSFHILS